MADRGNPVLQGTMGLEILRHCPAHLRRDLHAIFVPIGGGGEFLLQHCALSVLQTVYSPLAASSEVHHAYLKLWKKAMHMQIQ